MNVVHLSSSLSRKAGGIFEIELALAKALQSIDVHSKVIGLNDQGWASDQDRWESVDAQAFPIVGPESFGYARGLYRNLLNHPSDLGHLHTLWMYPSIAIRNWSKKTKTPYVVTPNGMLEPWALQNSAWKKRIASSLYEKSMLREASCLHVNTKKELQDCRDFGLDTPVAIIPNGVEIPEDVSMERKRAGGRKTLLFLGRLHPKKGLINAINGWSEASASDDWQFAIAGWDQIGHEAELMQACCDNSLSYVKTNIKDYLERPKPDSQIVFVGQAFGEHKHELLHSADAFILPSFSEGMPMSVLEAWAHRLPVVMTPQCNLDQGFESDAAFRVDATASSIATALDELFKSNDQTLESMGKNGRRLIETNYTWPKVAGQMKEVYHWLLGEGQAPDFVTFK